MRKRRLLAVLMMLPLLMFLSWGLLNIIRDICLEFGPDMVYLVKTMWPTCGIVAAIALSLVMFIVGIDLYTRRP